jgi:hypothetical protein
MGEKESEDVVIAARVLELRIEMAQCSMATRRHAVEFDCRGDAADAEAEREATTPRQGAVLSVENNVELRCEDPLLAG